MPDNSLQQIQAIAWQLSDSLGATTGPVAVITRSFLFYGFLHPLVYLHVSLSHSGILGCSR